MAQKPWTDTAIVGVLLGAAITFITTEFRARHDRRRTKEALSDLLWIELSENQARISGAPAVKDMELNTAVWTDVRVDLMKAGLDRKVAANVAAAYSLINSWNGSLKDDNYSHTPSHPSLDDMIQALEITGSLLGPSKELAKHFRAGALSK